jgi:hypothetical protein
MQEDASYYNYCSLPKMVKNCYLPLELSFSTSLLRKSVSEYLMKHPVLSARPSEKGKHPTIEEDACSRHALQELESKVLQQSART